MKKYSQLAEEAFAEEVTIDYTSLFGGEPYQISGAKQVEMWREQMEGLDSWQHITTSVLIDLPQPGAASKTPQTAQVIANCIVNLKRASAKGDSEIRNGGRYEFEVVRTDNDGNPWRISMLKADLVWFSGNSDVMGGLGKK
ncbi:NTF2-like protein [Venustampulla echinocandica]|uniref:NTF2-like protein n=1 Tax=Venustampulla echinocandica TaxID=2656787 RepID=A0A370TX25_9HELO|nr:NTF2-like protein [Venustampulla echinocandica]RDL40038.1 NTF2-like protein [Venustampulla echinocandica]